MKSEVRRQRRSLKATSCLHQHRFSPPNPLPKPTYTPKTEVNCFWDGFVQIWCVCACFCHHPSTPLGFEREMLAIRSRLLGVSHMCKSSPKHLLKFRAMSDISSVLVGNGTDISLGAFPKHLRKLPPWIQEPITVHEVHDIWKHVEDQSNEFKLLSSECVQKQIFEQEIRPFLLSRGLLCTSPMGSSFVKEVHQMNHKINHKFPRYVICKSLMKLLGTRSRKQWRPILEYLADERVIVLLDWINELSLLEVHFFDHGLLLAPQSGEPHDAVVCKVETDACYHKPEKSDDKK